jgi:hypothetical protein
MPDSISRKRSSSSSDPLTRMAWGRLAAALAETTAAAMQAARLRALVGQEGVAAAVGFERVQQVLGHVAVSAGPSDNEKQAAAGILN